MAGVVRLVPADFLPLVIGGHVATGGAGTGSNPSGNTNRIVVAGGTATSDPGDATYYVFDLLDDDGVPVVGGDIFTLDAAVQESAAPDLSSDSYVGIGLFNENTLGSATADGMMAALRYASATRNQRSISLANGTAGPADTAADVDIRTVRGHFIVTDAGIQASLFTALGSAMPRDHQGTPTARGAPGAAATAGARWKIAFAVGRTAATAGEVTIDFLAAYRVTRHRSGLALS